MEFEIFIKDNAFLPNSVDIKTGTNVVFMNEDRVKHNIHCKGHANFPILSIEIGGSEQYYFAVPGRYEISENGIGDMKCVVEATEIDRENIPKRNYFPTRKEKKLMEEQGAVKSEPPSPIFQRFNTAALGEDSQSSVMRHIDEYRTKRFGGGVAFSRPQKPAYSEQSSDDSGSGEDRNLAQQRHHVKTSVSKFGSSEIQRQAAPAHDYSTFTSTTPRAVAVATPPRTPPRAHAQPPTRPTHTHTHAPSLRTKLVLIEDYAFTVATLDLVVGQWVEFRLSEDVPAHAEHEICGVSTVKALCFESPLLQQRECTSYVYSPAHPGEIAVSCKIYPEMSCSIVVHPHCTNPSTPPISPSRASRQSRSPKVGFVPQRVSAHSQPDQRSPVSPTSPAYQDVGEGLLQFDASRSMSPRRGELSESQSSFYDSDDIFSDLDTPVKLEQSFDALASLTLPKTLGGQSASSDVPDNSRPATLAPKPRVASHNVSHLVTMDDFAFRPNHLVVRSGEWVRFRRPASQVPSSLVCEGEFVSSEVNWPVEGDYLSLDHCFTNPGSFDVQNVIFTFSKCNVIVIPQGVPATNNGRKGATPKLLGSFPSVTVAPVQPVFHFPLTEEDKKSVKVPPRYSVTTTTTVNATTTTTTISSSATSTANSSVSSMSSIMSVALSDHETELTQEASPSTKAAATTATKKGPTESTPLSRAVPLYGSFMNLSRNVPVSQQPASGVSNSGIPLMPLDSAADLAVGRYVNSLQTHEEGTDESDGADGEGNDAAAAARRKKKNQKKKEKLKLKQKLKKQAAQEAADAAEAAEREPLLGDASANKWDEEHERASLLEVDTWNLLGELGVGDLDGGRSPEKVIDMYLTDARVSRSYLQAQADWREDIDLDEDGEADADPAAPPAEEDLPKRGPFPPLPPSPLIPDPPAEEPQVSLTSTADDSAAQDHTAADTVALVAAISAPAGKNKRNRNKNKRIKSPGAEDGEHKEETRDLDQQATSMEDTAPTVVSSAAPVAPSTPPRTIPVPSHSPLPVPIEARAAVGQPVTVAPSLAESPAAPAMPQDATASRAGNNAVLLSPESFVTPTKTRKQRKDRSDRAGASSPALHPTLSSGDAVVAVSVAAQVAAPATPATPATQPRGTEDSASKRNSQLLRSVLRISPQRELRDSPAPSVLFPENDQAEPQPEKEPAPGIPRADSVHDGPSNDAGSAVELSGAGSRVSEAHLSACFAFEQQMEEFFMSRYDAVLAKFRSGQPDRLPSGKEVGIFYLEDMREVTVARGKAAHKGAKGANDSAAPKTGSPKVDNNKKAARDKNKRK